MPATSMYPLDDSERDAVDRRLRDRILDFTVLSWLIGGAWMSRDTLQTLNGERFKQWQDEEQLLSDWLRRARHRGLVDEDGPAADPLYRITDKGKARRNWLAHDPDLNGQAEAHKRHHRHLFGGA